MKGNQNSAPQSNQSRTQAALEQRQAKAMRQDAAAAAGRGRRAI